MFDSEGAEMEEQIYEIQNGRHLSAESTKIKRVDAEYKMPVEEKLKILTDAAKYDVACTSSGTERKATVPGSEIAFPVVFATAFLQTADAFLF